MVRLLALVAVVWATALTAPASAQTASGEVVDPGASAFTTARWSQIRPSKDFEGGCVIGFLAFQFSPTGYFIYNNRIRGSWRLDEIGNLKLRTREGYAFTMIVEGNIIRPTKDLPFAKRTFQYQKCSISGKSAERTTD